MNDPTPLYQAAEAASRAYSGDDDIELLWRFARDDQGVSKGVMEGVEQVESGFWIDARVFVSDELVAHSVASVERAQAADEVTPESIRVDPDPAVWYGPQQIRDHFDGDPSDLARWVLGQTDDVLLRVGMDAIQDDAVWEAFHRSLTNAVTDARIKQDYNRLEDDRIEGMMEAHGLSPKWIDEEKARIRREVAQEWADMLMESIGGETDAGSTD
jgi:hypothetical protein